MTKKRKEEESDEEKEEEEEEEEEEQSDEEPSQKKQRKHPKQFVDKRSIRKNIKHENSAASHDFEGKGLEWLPEDNNDVTAAQISKGSNYYAIVRCKENHKHEIRVSNIKILKQCPKCPKPPKPSKYTLEHIRAITKHVRVEGMDTDCWVFDKPYKQVWHNGKLVLLHVLVYILTHGQESYDKGIKEGKTDICHCRENPNCLEPNHIRQDTHANNCGDKVANGTNGEGEKHYNSKLKDYQRLEICRRNNEGESAKDLAAEFKVGVRTIYEVARTANMNPEELKVHREKISAQHTEWVKTRKKDPFTVELCQEIYTKKMDPETNKTIVKKPSVPNDSSIKFSDHSQCHCMTDCLDKDGYARKNFGGNCERETVFYHEIACVVGQGRLKQDEEVLTRHLCKEKACVNPEHFLFGTAAENMQDRWNRQREEAEEAAKLAKEQIQSKAA